MHFRTKAITLFVTLSTLFCVNTASAVTYELSNCAQLQNPYAVLLVHASWCGHCETYLPNYKAVSDSPQMSSYVFYTKQNDSLAPICGVKVTAVPVTFKNNMQQKLVGSASQKKLINFVKG